MRNDQLSTYRYFLKDNIRQKIDFRLTDQNQGIPVPAIEKPYPAASKIISLPLPEAWSTIPAKDITIAIKDRKSHRAYLKEVISLEELSYLLWCTQGLRKKAAHGAAFRNVPSAGCRHALETYLAILRVEGLKTGIYRYLPISHSLVFEFSVDLLAERLVAAVLGQVYPGNAATTFIWAAIPYRMEWRYGIAAHKVIALDAGHVCQNLYLACETINCGTCAIAAYNQEELDGLLGLDGEDEFAVYLAAVGKVKKDSVP